MQSQHSSDVVYIIGDLQAGLKCMLLGSQRGSIRVVYLRWSSDGGSTASAAGALCWSVVGSRTGADKGSLRGDLAFR